MINIKEDLIKVIDVAHKQLQYVEKLVNEKSDDDILDQLKDIGQNLAKSAFKIIIPMYRKVMSVDKDEDTTALEKYWDTPEYMNLIKSIEEIGENIKLSNKIEVTNDDIKMCAIGLIAVGQNITKQDLCYSIDSLNLFRQLITI